MPRKTRVAAILEAAGFKVEGMGGNTSAFVLRPTDVLRELGYELLVTESGDALAPTRLTTPVVLSAFDDDGQPQWAKEFATAQEVADYIRVQRELRTPKKNPPSEDRFAYKGYYVTYGAGSWHVSRDGHHIYSAKSPADARKAIDEVVG